MYLDSAILVKLVVHEPDSLYYVEYVDGQAGLLPVSADLIERANAILERCHPAVPLRSLDALHLAAAESAAAWPLVTNDERMRAAADLLRMPLVPLPARSG